MTNPESHYNTTEQAEIFDNWANEVTVTDPELAKNIVRNIVAKGAHNESNCSNSHSCGNTTVFYGKGHGPQS